jgi:uncharacterized membrane-anchored protein
MRLATLRRRHADSELPGVNGTARVGRLPAQVLSRLRPGDVAVLDQTDLDRSTADALVAAGVAAVVDASPVISGRYPCLGPEILVAAGIPVLDAVGTGVFGELRDGAKVRLYGEHLYAGENIVATGTVQNQQTVADLLLEAKAGLVAQLEAFAANTVEFVKRERTLLLDGVGVPSIGTDLGARHVLIVCRGYDHRRELIELRDYIGEYRPVLVGVDGGADALREVGYTPDLIVGDLDRVGDETLRCGAELVVLGEHPARMARAQDFGTSAVAFPAVGTATDAALLLAHAHGAQLVVTVGTRATLLDLLDRDQGAMASTFLTRLTLGPALVDAAAVLRLHRPRITARSLLLLAFAALLVVAVLAVVTPAGRAYLTVLGGWWDAAADRVRRWL